ncbi:MAG TPA: V-type ATP synthase subunit F [Candidatus Deferrimicrobiaceae bacterium]|jgi:vacuolar-type H+-ATPase subunit F/Vma7
MERIWALTDKETGIGFRLAGIATRAVSTPAELACCAEGLLSDPGAQVVLVDETLFRQLPEPAQRRIEGNERPVFVAVPSAGRAAGAARPEEIVTRLMQRAIGYQIRIRR